MAKKAAGPAKKPMTKSEIYQALADETGITKKQVQALFDALSGLIKKNLKKSEDTFTIPGMFKLTLKRKKAVKGGKQVLNRFTGEMTTTKDKPARNYIRARVLKGLNAVVE